MNKPIFFFTISFASALCPAGSAHELSPAELSVMASLEKIKQDQIEFEQKVQNARQKHQENQAELARKFQEAEEGFLRQDAERAAVLLHQMNENAQKFAELERKSRQIQEEDRRQEADRLRQRQEYRMANPNDPDPVGRVFGDFSDAPRAAQNNINQNPALTANSSAQPSAVIEKKSWTPIVLISGAVALAGSVIFYVYKKIKSRK